MSKIQDLLSTNSSASKRNIESVMVNVTGIIPVKPESCPLDSNGNPIPKSMIITKEHGNFWVLNGSIINTPESFMTPKQCSLTLEAVDITTKTGESKTVLNVLRAEFEFGVIQKIQVASTSGATLTF